MWISIFPAAFIVTSLLFSTIKKAFCKILCYAFPLSLSFRSPYMIWNGIFCFHSLIYAHSSEISYCLITFSIDIANLLIVQFHYVLYYFWPFIFPWTLDMSVCEVFKKDWWFYWTILSLYIILKLIFFFNIAFRIQKRNKCDNSRCL